ncbi:hypothetical protein KVV02_000820 [Mortierella alpina]|uniref:EF-hand domain-containing protein n=1 Tax=Mortierella alpina TaxID=64518 RepID=A0A9P8A2A9_MORAP|nr:hypothetical protein KVV02_000820 [Mortierella alpina]
MGAKHSKENKDLARRTHFSKREINTLRREFEKTSSVSRTSTFRRILHSSPLDDVFLTRLFSAFDTNPNSKGVNFKEFIEGLSVFMKGTPDEKLELSFKLYDVDHAGYITRPGLERAMTQLHSVVAGSSQDETHQIQELVKRIFDDLDVNNDGKLSLEEYKLNSMKEPLIIDFLGQFLADQTDSGSNSICSALSVPPSPRSGSSPPSPRFGHFAPPSPRLRDSLYGTASGHVLQSSSPAGSFRLSNSHSLLWLNGGVNGSGDLLGKVNEFEGLVAAEEEQQEKERRAALEKKIAAPRVSALAAVTPPVKAGQNGVVQADGKDSNDLKDTKDAKEGEESEVSSPVDIVVVPSEDSTETKAAETEEVKTAQPTVSGTESLETKSETPAPVPEAATILQVNGDQSSSTDAAVAQTSSSTAATAASDEVKESAQKETILKEVSDAALVKASVTGGLEVQTEPEPTVEETTAKLDIAN